MADTTHRLLEDKDLLEIKYVRPVTYGGFVIGKDNDVYFGLPIGTAASAVSNVRYMFFSSDNTPAGIQFFDYRAQWKVQDARVTAIITRFLGLTVQEVQDILVLY